MPNFYGKTGGRNLNSKTNAADVALMRLLAQYRAWPQRRIAIEFGLSKTTVNKIVAGVSWPNVDQAAELAKLQKRFTWFSNLHGGNDESEGAAESGRSPSPYVVESDHLIPTPSQVVAKRPPLISEKDRLVLLRDALVTMGVSHQSEVKETMVDEFDRLTPDQQRVLISSAGYPF